MCYVYRKCNPITLPWEKETTTILAYVSKWEQEGMLLIYLIDVAANRDNYVISPYIADRADHDTYCINRYEPY